MSEERVYVHRQPGVHILAALFVSLLIIVLAMWGMGMVDVAHPKDGSVVITVDFSKAERASHNAVDKTGQALEQAGKELREKAAQAPERQTPPESKTSPDEQAP